MIHSPSPPQDCTCGVCFPSLDTWETTNLIHLEILGSNTNPLSRSAGNFRHSYKVSLRLVHCVGPQTADCTECRIFGSFNFRAYSIQGVDGQIRETFGVEEWTLSSRNHPVWTTNDSSTPPYFTVTGATCRPCGPSTALKTPNRPVTRLTTQNATVSIGVRTGGGKGLKPPHYFQSGGSTPSLCISYCVAKNVTNNFIFRSHLLTYLH